MIYTEPLFLGVTPSGVRRHERKEPVTQECGNNNDITIKTH
jgi:hypothetical protein